MLGRHMERWLSDTTLLTQVEQENPWFKPDMTQHAIQAVRQWLSEDALTNWLGRYPLLPVTDPLRIGVVLAGNIPMVGFHDWLSVWMSGHILLAKYSSQDTVLLRAARYFIQDIAPNLAKSIVEVEFLKDADAYIATGSDNTSRYFEYYFASKPHIIRKNRVSAAVLTGNESKHELAMLGDDLFRYYGQGCRNVSYLWLPRGYNPQQLFEAWQPYDTMARFSKYFNNYEYQKAVLLMNNTEHWDNGFMLMKPSDTPKSPLAVIHYGYYSLVDEVHTWLKQHEQKLQCVVAQSNFSPQCVPFGSSQCPSLTDYADGVDVMAFLGTLQKP